MHGVTSANEKIATSQEATLQEMECVNVVINDKDGYAIPGRNHQIRSERAFSAVTCLNLKRTT
jgi:hypothetical protein